VTSFVSPQQEGLIPADETVRWSGTPRSGILFRSTDLFSIPFSLMFTVFAVFWESIVLRSGVVFMVLWGIPFLAVGLYGLVGRFFWDAYARARTQYVVTDRAAYVVQEGFRSSVRRFAGAQLSDLRVERNLSGGGTLRFGPDPAIAWGRTAYSGWSAPVNGFELAGDLDGAYAAVLAAQPSKG
jgi:hypothetical protein